MTKINRFKFFLLTTWLALLENLSIVRHNHWWDVLPKHQQYLKIHCCWFTALEREGSKADTKACNLHATRELIATNPRASIPKKEDTPKIALKTRSETDSIVLRASLVIFLNWVDDIIIFFKFYELKVEIELNEKKDNYLIKFFFSN